ncbi:MAG: hypothetical protein ACOH2O_03245 [Pseudomonas sp.]
MNSHAQCVLDCRQCAGLFRLGRNVEAALAMVDVFDHAQSLLSRGSPALQQQWLQLLPPMLACQEGLDWLGLADYLEYELVALLESES